MNINNDELELIAKGQSKLFLKQHPLNEHTEVACFHSDAFAAALARLQSVEVGSQAHYEYFVILVRLCYDLADIRAEALKNAA